MKQIVCFIHNYSIMLSTCQTQTFRAATGGSDGGISYLYHTLEEFRAVVTYLI